MYNALRIRIVVKSKLKAIGPTLNDRIKVKTFSYDQY